LVLLTTAAPAANIAIDTVSVGNAGNAPDQLYTFNNPDNLLFGSVGYEYRIGKHEVTNAQYAAFLNEKAKSDPLILYDANMASSPRGGVVRSGVSGSYTYSTKLDMDNKPVNFVDWYDALRFSNWLHNGQGTGSTESGAYTLLGGTPVPSNAASIARSGDAQWFLPSEDEWYKAAYYDPTLNSNSGGYWSFATQNNSAPSIATANSVGDITNPGANVANYNSGADWNSLDGNVTTVGSAGPLSTSYYRTSDQNGNLWEWNEASIFSTFRGLRGGAFYGNSGLNASDRNLLDPTTLGVDRGFRVGTVVPEPSSVTLAALALVGIVFLRRRSPGGKSGNRGRRSGTGVK